jgi:hypothetical protein
MKWGVRKAPTHAPSTDHVNAVAGRTKAKEGGLKALSNKELQDVITRGNLEKQFHDLHSGAARFEKGHSTIKKLIGVGNTINNGVSTINNAKKSIKIVKGLAGALA